MILAKLIRLYRRWRSYERVHTGNLVTFTYWLQLLNRGFPRVADPEAILDLGIAAELDRDVLLDRVPHEGLSDSRDRLPCRDQGQLALPRA